MASVPRVTTSVTFHPVFLETERQKERDTKRERHNNRDREGYINKYG